MNRTTSPRPGAGAAAPPADGAQRPEAVGYAVSLSGDRLLLGACDGVTTACPKDTYKISAIVCKPAGNECELPATCDGTQAKCPSNMSKNDGLPCNAGKGVCEGGKCTPLAAPDLGVDQTPAPDKGENEMGTFMDKGPATDKGQGADKGLAFPDQGDGGVADKSSTADKGGPGSEGGPGTGATSSTDDVAPADGGCDCQVGSTPAGVGTLCLLLLALSWRRRR